MNLLVFKPHLLRALHLHLGGVQEQCRREAAIVLELDRVLPVAIRHVVLVKIIIEVV